ncbi:MAG: serine protease [candidate division WOR-3 bacterium]
MDYITILSLVFGLSFIWFVSARLALLITSVIVFLFALIHYYPSIKPAMSSITNFVLVQPSRPHFDYLFKIRSNSGGCSAVVISKDYALTAAHCVDSLGQEVTVMLEDDLIVGKAKVVAIHPQRDVAILSGDFDEFKSVEVDFNGDYQFNLTNEKVVTCGFPALRNKKYCSLLMYKQNFYFKLGFVGGNIYKGMSGGPVVLRQMVNCKNMVDILFKNKCEVKEVLIGLNSAVSENLVIVSSLVGLLEELTNR